MKAFAIINDEPFIPEHVHMCFDTSGYLGGDAGHGGYARLIIKSGACPMTITLDGKSVETDRVEIATNGDWETEGFVRALVELGQKFGRKFTLTPAMPDLDEVDA